MQMTKTELTKRIELIRNGCNEQGSAAWADLLLELQQSSPRIIVQEGVRVDLGESGIRFSVDQSRVHTADEPHKVEVEYHFNYVPTDPDAKPKPTRGQEIAEKMVRADGGRKGEICINERSGNSYVHVFTPSHLDPVNVLANVRSYFAAAIDAAIAEEREACAKIARDTAGVNAGYHEHRVAKYIEHLIRARHE
jgi:hypothetical protein